MAAASGWQLDAGHWVPAKMAPVIIHPRPDAEMSAWARAARAPAGLAWSIPIVVQGGAWPFYYEITDNGGAAGLAIGSQLPSDWLTNGLQDYGVLSLSSPVVGSYPISIRVTDQDGTPTDVTFTLEVIASDNTTYFLFFDSATGSNANSGTPASPKQTINGWYLSSKTDSTHTGKQCFYKGTFQVGGSGVTTEGTGERTPLTNAKPHVHVAWPGFTATIDMNTTFISDEGTSGDAAYIGIDWINPQCTDAGLARKSFIRISAPDRALIFLNTFTGGDSAGDSGTNSASVMFSGVGATWAYPAVIQNTFDNNDYMDFVLAYGVTDYVFEGNVVTTGSTGGTAHGMYLKGGDIEQVTVRANRGIAAGIDSPLVRSDWLASAALRDNIEVCWNLWKADLGVHWGATDGTYGNNNWVYRNHWQINYHWFQNVTAGTVEFINDVTQHDGSQTNGLYMNASTMTITRTNLTPTATSGLLDATSNLLTGGGLTYLGTHGAEVQ